MSNKIPRENAYQCHKCNRLTITVDVDEGVTPFMLECRADWQILPDGLIVKNGCRGEAYSSFYPKMLRPPSIPAPKWEWYKPDDAEIQKLSKLSLQHVAQGGLLIRPRTDKEPIYHEEVDGRAA